MDENEEHNIEDQNQENENPETPKEDDPNEDGPKDELPPLKKAREKRMSTIKKDMDDLRDELKDLRFIYRKEDDNYDDMKNDPEYDLLFKDGGFTKDDYEIHEARMYPSWEQMEKKYEEEKDKNKHIPIDWKKYDNKVYIREFYEDAEQIQEELKKMRKGRHRLTPAKLTSELALSKKDLEKKVGENLGKISGVILSIGLLILYKYAISLGYVSQQARMVIGVFFGIAFLGGAHYLLSKKTTISTVLVCSGSAVLYYTLSLVYQEYHIITSQPYAFGVGLIITALITFLAVFYNRKELSIVALAGGFIMPFTLGIGIGSYNLFFAYNFGLNLIMLAIAYIKNWRLINYSTFTVSVILLFLWYLDNAAETEAYHFSLFVYATLFYLMFFVAIVLYNIKEENKFTRRDSNLFIANTVLFVITGLYFLKNTGIAGVGKPLFFGLTGTFNLAYIIILFNKPQICKRLKDLLIVSATTFITLAGFTKLNYIYVNTFWAIEAPFLLWLGIRYKQKVLLHYSAYLTFGALVSMFYAWYQSYFTEEEMYFILNRGFWTGFISFASVGVTVALLRKVDNEQEQIGLLPKYYYVQIIGLCVLIAGYLCGFFELLFHTQNIIGGQDFRTLIIDAYTMMYALVVRWVVQKEKIERLRVFTGALMAIIVMSYLVAGHWSSLRLRDAFLAGASFYPYSFHYINVGLSILIVYLLITDIVSAEGYKTKNYTYVIWFMSIMTIIHATFEFEHTIVLLRSKIFHADTLAVLDQVRLTGWSVLWSVLAFIGVFLGMKFKVKEVRWVSLVLFGVTILKFFIFDFWSLETLWKIISILIIGAVLGIVGMMYSKLKTIIIEGELPENLISSNDSE